MRHGGSRCSSTAGDHDELRSRCSALPMFFALAKGCEMIGSKDRAVSIHDPSYLSFIFLDAALAFPPAPTTTRARARAHTHPSIHCLAKYTVDSSRTRMFKSEPNGVYLPQARHASQGSADGWVPHSTHPCVVPTCVAACPTLSTSRRGTWTR